MDTILNTLQGNAFHLSNIAYDHISKQYTDLLAVPIPDLKLNGFNPGTIRQMINYHRDQFQTREYIKSRIDNPTTGTIDHLHAEITADIAVKLGTQSNYSNYAIELLRVSAHFHDSDRSFPLKMIQGEEEVRHDLEKYAKYKKRHAANSARIARLMCTRAAWNGYKSPEGFIKDLSYLIVRHELGGDKGLQRNSAVVSSLNLNDLTDILTESDSLAYFEANILTNWEECGKSKSLLRNKVHFMYDRLTPLGRLKLKELLLETDEHILGKQSVDDNINEIREVLFSVII